MSHVYYVWMLQVRGSRAAGGGGGATPANPILKGRAGRRLRCRLRWRRRLQGWRRSLRGSTGLAQDRFVGWRHRIGRRAGGKGGDGRVLGAARDAEKCPLQSRVPAAARRWIL